VSTGGVRRDCAFCGRERSAKDDNHDPACAYWRFFGTGAQPDPRAGALEQSLGTPAPSADPEADVAAQGEMLRGLSGLDGYPFTAVAWTGHLALYRAAVERAWEQKRGTP